MTTAEYIHEARIAMQKYKDEHGEWFVPQVNPIYANVWLALQLMK